ncbi:hypothetical protein [Ascidiimonas sp. W6]|uniref:hypothetical protein n=1 Tax=Ascidiimonas meishanensis TaxID=3128903 RepID=UPI0030EC81A6
MKKLTFLLLAMVIGSCQPKKQEQPTSEKDLAQATIETAYCFDLSKVHFCEDKTDTFCSELPLDVQNMNSADGGFGFGYTSKLSPEFQPSFDLFSWQTFIALNWPADASGNPTGDLTDHPDALRVWEHYTDVNTLFEANTNALTAKNKLSSEKPTRFFYLDSKSPTAEVNPSSFLQADGYPLIDRNLNFVVFEEKVNAIEEGFITSNDLTTKAGIDAYYNANNQTFEMPVNTASLPGAMEIKASWRILDTSKGDDLSKYYHQNAVIYISAESSATGEAFTINCIVGLVGLHIVRKTEKFKDWIWSTFEHVDNVPDNPQQAQDQMEKQWSFYNPECLNCEPNTPPPHVAGDTVNNKVMYRWNSTAPYAARYAQSVPGETGDGFGTQVTRVYPIYFCTEQMNAIWQAALKNQNSVFANYRLIGSQWTKSDGPTKAPDAPFFLGSITAETYMQNTSSCITCHNFAGITYQKTKIKTDFSFIFGNAE